MTEEEFMFKLHHLIEMIDTVSDMEYSMHYESLVNECENIVVYAPTGEHKLPWMKHYHHESLTVRYMIISHIHTSMKNVLKRIHDL